MHKTFGDPAGPAVRDSAHLGDIKGALGSIGRHDVGVRATWRHRMATLMAIIGPGLIVMVGDNDAGAFSTYTQAGQNYGTSLLWTLVVLVPVLYVNQEMVLRLGAVTGVGHARLIFERFGRFWGAFSFIDLLLLNALTIVTEFIGITLALDYLGVPRLWGVAASAAIIIAAAATGSFRRFEQVALVLVGASLLLVPVLVMVHPPAATMLHDLAVPQLPAHGAPADVMLLIIAIVGTTIAPWQLFFQQSYVIDKRITPRFLRYGAIDLIFGIVLVLVGGVAMIGFTAAAFAGAPDAGHFQDAGAVAAMLGKTGGHVAGTCFALALLDASIIGAMAVSLATAYAVGDVLSVRHSLHRKPREARAFFVVYAGLIILAAALVLTPGTPLGLLTSAVQTLAGVLLPSATVFLLLLCNDPMVLGPWVNGRWSNLFTGLVIAVLVILSVILTAAVLFPDLSAQAIFTIAGVGAGFTALMAVLLFALAPDGAAQRMPRAAAERWRMPSLDLAPRARVTPMIRIWMFVLRAYLVVAGGLVLYRIVLLSTGGQ